MSPSEILRAERITKSYVRHSIFRFQGFCRQLDAELLRDTVLFQTQNGISGSLAEIGVWHGKSFFILAKARMRDEKALAIDLFATRPLVPGERQQADDFADNCRTAGVPLAESEILKCDSIGLSADDVLGRAGRVRLFHVDGAHDYEHAIHDIDLARDCVIEGGAIVVDDAFNRQWPEVTAALCDWMRRNRDYVPWAITEHKLYMAHRSRKSFYEGMVREKFRSQIGRPTTLFGDDVYQLDQSLIATLREKTLTRLLTPRPVDIPKAV